MKAGGSSGGATGFLGYLFAGFVLACAMAALKIMNAPEPEPDPGEIRFSKAQVELSRPERLASSSAAGRRAAGGSSQGGVELVEEGAVRDRGSVGFVAERQGASKNAGSMGYLSGGSGVIGVAGTGREEDDFAPGNTRRRLEKMISGGEAPPLAFSGVGGPPRLAGRLVRTKMDWDGLWKAVGGHDMPELDFGRRMAVAVFGGTQPAGTKIQVVSAKPVKNRFVVEFQILKPLPSPGGPDIRPYQVLIVPASDLPPVFRKAK